MRNHKHEGGSTLNKIGGFTILEFIVSMALIGIIFVFVGSMTNQFSNVSTFVNRDLSNKQGITQVFQTMTSEIRSAGPSSVGDYAIQSASSTEFTFFSDVDGDGLFERVRYFFTTSTLNRGIVKPAGEPLVYATSSETIRVLVSGVIPASSSFYYYDANYTGSEPPLAYPIDVSTVRAIEIRLYVDLRSGTAPQAVYYNDVVTIRNLRSN